MNPAQPLCEVLESRVLLAADACGMCPVSEFFNSTLSVEPMCLLCEGYQELEALFVEEDMPIHEDSASNNEDIPQVKPAPDNVPSALLPSDTLIIDQYSETLGFWQELWINLWNRLASLVSSDTKS